jgi:hypothetical protein
MISEATDATYTDADLATYIETYPVIDADGNAPDDADWDSSSLDLNAAASTIWTEKAVTLAGNFDFTADSATFNRSQAYAQYMKMARFYNARRQPGTIQVVVSPKPTVVEWIGNLAAEDI